MTRIRICSALVRVSIWLKCFRDRMWTLIQSSATVRETRSKSWTYHARYAVKDVATTFVTRDILDATTPNVVPANNAPLPAVGFVREKLRLHTSQVSTTLIATRTSQYTFCSGERERDVPNVAASSMKEIPRIPRLAFTPAQSI